MMLDREAREATPAAAKIENVIAGTDTKLAADEREPFLLSGREVIRSAVIARPELPVWIQKRRVKLEGHLSVRVGRQMKARRP